jgi:hypothetical protein
MLSGEFGGWTVTTNPTVPLQLRAPDTTTLCVDESKELLNHRISGTGIDLIIPGIALFSHGKKE